MDNIVNSNENNITKHRFIIDTTDDNYIITGTEDRLDLIAYDFYGDSTLWWVIAMVNDLEGDSMYPPAGIYLRIPQNISELLNTYIKSNF